MNISLQCGPVAMGWYSPISLQWLHMGVIGCLFNRMPATTKKLPKRNQSVTSGFPIRFHPVTSSCHLTQTHGLYIYPSSLNIPLLPGVTVTTVIRFPGMNNHSCIDMSNLSLWRHDMDTLRASPIRCTCNISVDSAHTGQVMRIFSLLLALWHNDTKTFVTIRCGQWRHNESDGVTNHRRLDYLLSRLFSRR